MSADPLAALLGFDRTLQVADIGAAVIGSDPPPYQPLLDAGLGHLHAFDADERQHAALSAAHGSALSLYADIIGDGRPGELHLASPVSGMSSLLAPAPERLAMFNGFSGFAKPISTVAVQTTRLDDVADLPALDFLKMDIQGGELTALMHGTERLAACAMIQLEVSFVPLYEGQPTFGEIDVWMRANGFIPHCFTEVKRWSLTPVLKNNDMRLPFNQLLEADIVYVRDIFAPAPASPDLMRAVALIAHHSYGSIDLAGHLIARMQREGLLAADALRRYFALVNAAAR